MANLFFHLGGENAIMTQIKVDILLLGVMYDMGLFGTVL